MLSWPNRITVGRLLLVVPFIILLLNAADGPLYRYGALGLALLIGAADAADGMLARRTGAVTRIGSILDPIADKSLMISAFIVLTIPGVLDADRPELRLPYWVSVTLVGRDLFILVGGVVVYLLVGMFQALPSAIGKTSTVLQFLMIAATIASPDLVTVAPTVTWWTLHGLWFAVVGLAIVSWLGYIRLGSKLVTATPDKS